MTSWQRVLPGHSARLASTLRRARLGKEEHRVLMLSPCKPRANLKEVSAELKRFTDVNADKVVNMCSSSSDKLLRNILHSKLPSDTLSSNLIYRRGGWAISVFEKRESEVGNHIWIAKGEGIEGEEYFFQLFSRHHQMHKLDEDWMASFVFFVKRS